MSAARDLQYWLDRADALTAAGRYFDAHEELESAWKSASGDDRLALQGVIQLAAGLHRLRLSPEKPDGAFYLFDRGLQKLRAVGALIDAPSLAALEAVLSEIRRSGHAPERMRFGLRVADIR
ncbi:MAG: DUF309 domain-containing protein [Elusimicrobia bacterium]|nr:DUF309 domain-containing protein [Elusimicrobiota bacterium]